MVKVRKAVLASVVCCALLFTVACDAAAIQAYINLAISIALQVAQLAGLPPAVAEKVSGDLGAANKVYNDLRDASASAQPGLASKADALFNAAETDLELIFTTANVNDPEKRDKIRAAVAIAITAIESARTIALAHAPSPVKAALTKTVRAIPVIGQVAPSDKRLKPAQLKALYNHTVAAYPNAQIK